MHGLLLRTSERTSTSYSDVGLKDYLKKLKEEDPIPMWDEVDFAEFFFPRFALSDK